MGFVNSPPTSANCPTKRPPVFGSRVRSPWCARPRWTGSWGSGQERGGRRGRAGREEAVPLRWGQPGVGGGGAGDGRLGHTPVSSSVILWDFPKEAAGLREGGRVSERATRGDVTVAPWPFQGPAPGGTRTGSRVGPGPLGLAVSLGRPPASLPQQRRAAGRREGLRGARPSSPGRQRSRGLRSCRR